jgi:hypothetical protein
VAKLKLVMDDDLLARIRRISSAGGYSSAEEFVLHVLGREIERLDPDESESEQEIRKKLEGLGYLT